MKHLQNVLKKNRPLNIAHISLEMLQFMFHKIHKNVSSCVPNDAFATLYLNERK